VRTRAAGLVVLLVAGVALSGAPAVAQVSRGAPVAPQCDPLKPGGELTDTPWAQTRLNFQRAWQVSTGRGVVVAVIDTGLDTRHQQMLHTRIAQGRNVIGGGFSAADTRDCSGSGHGTSVTSVIAAQHLDGLRFDGVAPDVTIVPIKQTNTAGDKSGTAAGIAAGIDAAIDAKARVVNISVTVANPGGGLRAAVARAAKKNLVIVAAAGNDGQGNNFPAYPAAYSTDFPNVIAVSASDAQDGIAPFADTGNYVTVAAPGVGVVVPAPISGYTRLDGTSFAAPYVTGTVALVLAAHPTMTAAQVRNRIEATADRPPATVPDRRYGYGVINPFLAVTAIRDDTVPVPSARREAALPALAVARPADRHLAHVALASAVALLALAVLAAASAAVLRGQRRSRDPSLSASD
jgi:membrane-anchored mycosin MYCP